MGRKIKVKIKIHERGFTAVQAENGIEIKTRFFRVSEENFDAVLEEAAEIIRKGGTVAFPTETVYGLGADGLRPEAVRKIFEAKQRPPGNPLSLLIHSREDLQKIVVNVPENAFKLMDAFWPGPLTLVLEKSASVPAITSGNLPSVGVRMPDHWIPLELVKRAGRPLAAPSANLSGRPSPSSAAHVLADLEGRIDVVLDGGVVTIGVESTVVDMTVEPPVILRPGAIGLEALEEIVGEVRLGYGSANEEAGDAPSEKLAGQKYGHYTPDTAVVLVEGAGDLVAEKIGELTGIFQQDRLKVGFLLSEESTNFLDSKGLLSEDSEEWFLLGARDEPDTAARRLFEGLRVLDVKGLDVILADGSFSTLGLGIALMDRLKEAASTRVEV